MTVEYSMRISRLTVDKLGVKLYDRVSAVIAELIANAYDADAEHVTVEAPMGQALASRAGGELTDKGFEIKVVDDGIGMTPQEMQDFYLVVGGERREDPRRGPTSGRSGSRQHQRKVMGRKGVGKLAPFGICKVIEVRSAGGELVMREDRGRSEQGYLTSHIVMNYKDILAVDDEPDTRYLPGRGEDDESLSPATGTTITLLDFNFRRVPAVDVLSRQIAQRFGIQSPSWQIDLADNTQANAPPVTVGRFDVQVMPNTRLNFREDGTVLGPDGNDYADAQAGFEHEGTLHPVTGWMAYSRQPYRDDLMAGVRIYCRGKIAAQTSVFNRKAGFTGEHNVRSYLIGELHADWLDEEEDLIQTDRRDILWSDDLASAFQDWGQDIVRRIGTLSRDPMRKATLDLFLETGNVEQRVRDSFPTEEQQGIRAHALDIAKTFGRTISRPEAEEEGVVDALVDLSITLAPHITLDEMMRSAVESADTPITALGEFLRTARIAELSSFGRIAEDRLKVIERLDVLKDGDHTDEASLQRLIEEAPWLINPEWAPVTANQSLSTLRREFETYYEEQTGQPIQLLNFQDPARRPDFVLSSQEGLLQILEIKRPGHRLSNDEMARIRTYHECMDAFLNDPSHELFRQWFRGFHITLVCDHLAVEGPLHDTLELYLANGRMSHIDWAVFLARTQEVHQDFLDEAERQRTNTVRTEANGP